RDVGPYGHGQRDSIRRSSSRVRGKNLALSETNAAGRQDAGRPHISILESVLCDKPMTWPISCALTLRVVLGSGSGQMARQRIATTPLLPGRHCTLKEMRSAWVRMTTMSPGVPESLERSRLVDGPPPRTASP